VADLQLRRLERSNQGDPQSLARKIHMRVRTGQISSERVTWAAHLGDSTARMIDADPRIITDCPSCQALRDARTRRNRDPRSRPTPIRETPRQCLHCKGSEKVVLEKGLIRFVQQIPVPHRLLIAWGADCAEHQLETLVPNPEPVSRGMRYRLPNAPTPQEHELPAVILPAVRRWVHEGVVDPVLYQRASHTGSVRTDVGVAASLATAVVRSGVEDEERMVRFRIGEVASMAYHAAGGTRSERTWQEERLIGYLLGNCG